MVDQPTVYKYVFGMLHQITPATEHGTRLLLEAGWSLSKAEAARKACEVDNEEDSPKQ